MRRAQCLQCNQDVFGSLISRGLGVLDQRFKPCRMLDAHSLGCLMQLVHHETSMSPASAEQTQAPCARQGYHTTVLVDAPRACMTATATAALLDTPFCATLF